MIMTYAADQDQPLIVGDRVRRVSFLPNDSTPQKVGKIVTVYQSTPTAHGQSVTLYAVLWDTQSMDYVERGYMRSGLEKVD